MEIGSQQVESIEVELEYLFSIVVDSVAFFVRQTAEVQCQIILFLFEIMTTIFTGLGADVSFAEIVRQFAMGISLARHEGVHRVLGLSLQLVVTRLGNQVAIQDIFLIGYFDSVDTDISLFKSILDARILNLTVERISQVTAFEHVIFFRTDIEGDFFFLHDVSRFKGRLFFLDSVVSILYFINARVRDRVLTVIYRFIYQVVKRVGSLTINTTLGTEQGRSRLVIVGIDDALSQFIQIYRLEHLFDVHTFSFKQFGVVVVPFQGVGDVEGNQITGIVRDFVRNAEHRVGTRLMRFAVDINHTDVGIFLLNGSEIFGQQYQAFFVAGFAGLGIANGYISRIDKV